MGEKNTPARKMSMHEKIVTAFIAGAMIAFYLKIMFF